MASNPSTIIVDVEALIALSELHAELRIELLLTGSTELRIRHVGLAVSEALLAQESAAAVRYLVECVILLHAYAVFGSFKLIPEANRGRHFATCWACHLCYLFVVARVITAHFIVIFLQGSEIIQSQASSAFVWELPSNGLALIDDFCATFDGLIGGLAASLLAGDTQG